MIISLAILTSCTPVVQPVVVQNLPGLTSTPDSTTVPNATSTSISPSPTTTQNPCDPVVVDFCITEGHFTFQNPIHPPGNTFVDTTYRYGSTQNESREPHHGVEYLNKFGTPVHAAGDGVIQFAGPDKEAVYSPWRNFYGNVVVIGHDNEMYTLYAHLSKVDVEVGDVVKAGDLIGEVGDSGVATGSHLHFEVRHGGDGMDYFSTQNPELWLMPNRGQSGEVLGAIALSVLDKNNKVQYVEFTADYHLNKNDPKITSYFLATYSKSMMYSNENAALGDLLPGYYRIALKYNGYLYERWVKVESGKLTLVVFVVK